MNYSVWTRGLYGYHSNEFYAACELRDAHKNFEHSVVLEGDGIILLSKGVPVLELVRDSGVPTLYVTDNYGGDDLFKDVSDFALSKAKDMGMDLQLKNLTGHDSDTRKKSKIINDEHFVQY